MDNINNFINHNPKYKGLQKPLTAARVCDTARELSDSRYEVISFKDGLLTLGVGSGAQSAEIQMQSTSIIKEINDKLGKELVLRLRYKIIG
jgi:hypothetical protein